MSEYKGSLLRPNSTYVSLDNVPGGFEARSVDFGSYKKILYFCTKNLAGGNRCDFCIRKADATKNPNRLNHECKYINRLESYSPDIQITAMLYDSIYEFIGSRNVSFSSIASDEFTDIILNAIILGQKNPKQDYKTLYIKMSASTLSRKWNFLMTNKFSKKVDNDIANN